MSKFKGRSHPSSSEAQSRAEEEMRGKLQTRLGCSLIPRKIEGEAGESLEIDGYSEDPPVLCEIYAHIGSLKGSQPRKPLADGVKMAVAELWLGRNCRKVFAFADPDAASIFQSASWQAEAMRLLNVEIAVVTLEERTKKLVTEAQQRQYR